MAWHSMGWHSWAWLGLGWQKVNAGQPFVYALLRDLPAHATIMIRNSIAFDVSTVCHACHQPQYFQFAGQ
jgi:hypothetical protein